MTAIPGGVPRVAALIGIAGLIPFIWGALTVLIGPLGNLTTEIAGARFAGRPLLIGWGTVIMCFMSGALWGFASRANAPSAYVLSVLPALWVFFFTGDAPPASLRALLMGFIGLLALDAWFWFRKLAPGWWMHLRILLTIVVITCLALGLYA